MGRTKPGEFQGRSRMGNCDDTMIKGIYHFAARQPNPRNAQSKLASTNLELTPVIGRMARSCAFNNQPTTDMGDDRTFAGDLGEVTEGSVGRTPPTDRGRTVGAPSCACNVGRQRRVRDVAVAASKRKRRGRV